MSFFEKHDHELIHDDSKGRLEPSCEEQGKNIINFVLLSGI